ncbi:PPC domain-containing DNA-binding protein [Bdellovibrio svalbardensis]|uniref:DNA-binding protein n=1 Tax=Bdellovibrio svalbardensis TaxID=2972972 RepID=A0ABT6DKE2_9BACT|nr:PPC domain-containing DNA-binding protein [Bdellovibrio svalbardensis]MDG0817332.1 DNA-binding protein [Bdellovibrio svalbardensis]
MIPQVLTSRLTSFCFRLRPGQDLKKELLLYAETHQLKAAAILSAVGSLKVACLRLSDRKETSEFTGPFEIVSLMGTVSASGIHMHMSISDGDGKVLGGHLMDGCLVYTTAEIILLESTDLVFDRQMDEGTGYKELVVKARE